MNLDNITSDETFNQAKRSSSSTTTDSDGSMRARKVNWTSGAEQETYRTVVINYSYAKMDQDQNQNQGQNKNPIRNLNRSQSQIENRSELISTGNGIENGNGKTKRNRRTREMWKKTCVDMRDQQQQQSVLQSVTRSDSDLNLHRLYGSMQELKFEERPLHKAEVMVEPLKAHRKEDIVMMKPELKTIDEDCEVIVISDDEDEDHQLRAVLNNSKTTSTTSHYLTISESKSTDMSEKLLPLDSMENIEEKLKIKMSLAGSQSQNKVAGNRNGNANNGSSQKLKVKVQPTNNYKQRQLELHRARIAVEQKRLELLEVKLARERDEMIREQVLFEKELELKSSQLRQFTEDRV